MRDVLLQMLILLVSLFLVAASGEKRSVNMLLEKIENICDGDSTCSDDLMDNLVDYLYDDQPIGKFLSCSLLK